MRMCDERCVCVLTLLSAKNKFSCAYVWEWVVRVRNAYGRKYYILIWRTCECVVCAARWMRVCGVCNAICAPRAINIRETYASEEVLLIEQCEFYFIFRIAATSNRAISHVYFFVRFFIIIFCLVRVDIVCVCASPTRGTHHISPLASILPLFFFR